MERSSPLKAVAAIHYFWEYLRAASPTSLGKDRLTAIENIEGNDCLVPSDEEFSTVTHHSRVERVVEHVVIATHGHESRWTFFRLTATEAPIVHRSCEFAKGVFAGGEQFEGLTYQRRPH